MCMYVHVLLHIKTHGCVSETKKDVWHTSVLFTGTAKSPFSTPHISISTGPISIKFIQYILCPSYMQLYMPNLKKIG